jgi:hypothetical protein
VTLDSRSRLSTSIFFRIEFPLTVTKRFYRPTSDGGNVLWPRFPARKNNVFVGFFLSFCFIGTRVFKNSRSTKPKCAALRSLSLLCSLPRTRFLHGFSENSVFRGRYFPQPGTVRLRLLTSEQFRVQPTPEVLSSKSARAL